MYFVAHEDDDLLFMNPDIADSIAAGNRVVIVHLTSGDLTTSEVASSHDHVDFTRYWVDRERGILNSYAYMALGPDHAFDTYVADGVPDGWTARMLTAGGVAMPQYDLVAPSGQTLSAVFMRLSDFELQGAWNDLPGAGGQQLAGAGSLPAGATITDGCDGDVCPLGTALASQMVSRDQLQGALEALIEQFGGDSVSAQDATTPTSGPSPSGMFWDSLGTPSDGFTDYWDHVFSAAFTLAAATRAQATLDHGLAVRLYRGYTLSQEPPNLSPDEARTKIVAFAYYALFDDTIVAHSAPFDVDDPRVAGDYKLSGSGSWETRELATRTLRGTEPIEGRIAVGGLCLGVAGGVPATVACDGAPAWIATALGQLQLARSPSCVALDATGAAILAPCAPRAVASTLLLFANGQLRTPDAKCLSADAGTIASVECAHEPLAPHATGRVPASQDWTMIFDRARVVSSQFSDATPIASAPSYYETFRLVHQQICARGPAGLACAPFAGGGLGPAQVIDPTVGDAAGWLPEPYGATVAASWDPVAGAIVSCGRGPDALHCGTATTEGFSDGQGWDDRESYFGSIRYGALAAGGALAACGRSEAGIACASGLGPLHVWTTGFSDAAGWADPAYGDTIALGDVDGDGLADACGRSAAGIECEIQHPRDAWNVLADHAAWSFDEDRTASVAADFSDGDPAQPWAASAAAYRSFRLVDVNRDGLADACARGAGGIWCAFSTGTAFERKKLVIPDEFTDERGWGAPAAGATITWGDLDGDARIDVCGRAAAGVTCASGY